MVVTKPSYDEMLVILATSPETVAGIRDVGLEAIESAMAAGGVHARASLSVGKRYVTPEAAAKIFGADPSSVLGVAFIHGYRNGGRTVQVNSSGIIVDDKF